MLHSITCELEEFSRHTTTDTLSLVEEICRSYQSRKHGIIQHTDIRLEGINYFYHRCCFKYILLIVNPILSLKQRLVVSNTLQVFVRYITLF